jgi:hypothetical protein
MRGAKKAAALAATGLGISTLIPPPVFTCPPCSFNLLARACLLE